MTRDRITVASALGAVYLIWGSTYLALRYGLEGFPPFLLNSFRFLSAGTLLYAVMRWTGREAPTRKQWANSAKIAVFLLIGGVALVTVAEDNGVGSGVAATAVAAVPLWAAVFGGVFGGWPSRLEWIGLLIGFAGVIVLAGEGDLQSSPLGLSLVVISPVFWAFGSVWSKRLDLPSPLMAAATQMLAGGAMLAVLGLARGERIVAAPPSDAILALLYLSLVGSIVGFGAYVYLLDTVRPSIATSYAYVNPVVAVVLGITIGNERLTGAAWVALPLIVIGVVLVLSSRSRPSKTSDEPVCVQGPVMLGRQTGGASRAAR